MTDHFWRVKRPVSRGRMKKARDVLERVSERAGSTDWLDVLEAMDDYDLVTFAAPLTGRSPAKIRERLSVAGILRLVLDLGRHSKELKKLWPM